MKFPSLAKSHLCPKWTDLPAVLVNRGGKRENVLKYLTLVVVIGDPVQMWSGHGPLGSFKNSTFSKTHI